MAGPDRIEGCAIVSRDGMIADASGIQPDALKPEADQALFYAAIERADALVHGRHSSEDRRRSARRKRLVMTRGVHDLAPDPNDPWALFWNPEGASLTRAWSALGLDGGRLLVIGGTEPFGLFLAHGYDQFDLTTAGDVTLPGGRPVFPGVPAHTADQRLRETGHQADAARQLAPHLTLTRWHRPHPH